MKIFFSDVDHTFISHEAPLPPVNRKAMREVEKKGHRLVFVTGRAYSEFKELQKQYRLRNDVIYCNGAGICYYGEKPQVIQGITLAQLMAALEMLDQSQALYMVNTADGDVMRPLESFQTQLDELEDHLSKEVPPRPMKFIDHIQHETRNAIFTDDVKTWFLEHPETVIVKLLVYTFDYQAMYSLQPQLDAIGLHGYFSFAVAFEITHQKANKGEALRYYCQDLPVEKTYGFGDMENDLPMLEAADVGIAVSNGAQGLKARADEVIGECSEGAVGAYILKEIADSSD